MQPAVEEMSLLLDRLDELVRQGKVVPLTGQVRIERGEIDDIVRQLREALATIESDGGKNVPVSEEADDDSVWGKSIWDEN